MLRRKNPYYDPAKYHHRPDGFRNPPGSPPGHRITAELAREAAHFLGELVRLAGHYPFPDDHVIPQEQAIALLQAQTAPRTITWLGHASFLLQLDGRVLLTDPFLTDYASPVPSVAVKRLVPPGIAIEHLPVVDTVLISHNHYDHLDARALSLLARRFPHALVCVPLGLRDLVQKQGFTHVVELDWYDRHADRELVVMAVPAVHTSRRGIGDTNRSLWCGFRCEINDYSCYFAGDTAYGEVFADIGNRLGPCDLGLVPIGAYQPRVLMAPVHATPEDAVQIGVDLGVRQLIGMHWGTIRLTTEPMLEPAQRFLAAPGAVPRRVMRIGETLAL
jgi:N-acyl-phosphatidylethanolamine-hydrolysing phospholipase D